MRKTCTLELVGLRRLAALTLSREVSTIDHVLTNLQPLVTCRAKVAKTNQKYLAIKVFDHQKNRTLGFLRKQQVIHIDKIILAS